MPTQKWILFSMLILYLSGSSVALADSYTDALARLERERVSYEEMIEMLKAVLNDKEILVTEKVYKMVDILQMSRIEKTDATINALFDRARAQERNPNYPEDAPSYDELIKTLEAVLDDNNVPVTEKVDKMLDILQASRIEKTDATINGLFDRARELRANLDYPPDVVKRLRAIAREGKVSDGEKLKQMSDLVYRENLLGVVYGHNEKMFKIINEERASTRRTYINSRPALDAKIKAAIQGGDVFLGMTDEEVMASWGYPDSINKTVTSFGSVEQWVYSDRYLYFEDGKLRSWQE